ncbi:ribonucleoside-triphosphate reductase, adenosylcobalamin-dependent [Streptomyces sp. ID05-39B]|uniref:ribonucleoside-triphosphate reductase, adenosylcobalamin-dependent n=1 Tax=Streptomyces sp. ID05-39B TaxID=3028664 RepID=UPI0029AD1CAC|nr:ribonucleoside-triphosphate reductase, adenosylcobalamin-dependent [Streptomyces sp. ID05-39B]MDX3525043.1 ribonucleoside-triphosphate reductase, adenosylcobalamin-dependent [Streptomyces sp. ID05-39B]
MTDVPFGPTGELVYNRTYSRTLADGSKETWPDTVRRVAAGNLALVHGPDKSAWGEAVIAEYNELVAYMDRFAIIPAGRHLWATGVKGRQYLFNCHVAPWGEKLSRHFEFTFMRLMEGGGVGGNYSSEYLQPYGAPRRELDVHVVCDPMHQDYEEMKAAGLLSEEYDSDWAGAFEVEDSREGWAGALVDLIDTFMTGDEVKHRARVYDVSRVRCKGSRLKTFGGTASGPGPFARMLQEVAHVLNRSRANMPIGATVPAGWYVTPVEAMEIDHAIAECVVSGGVRRSARMAICAWYDPFIDEFLACKADGSKHWTTNISVEIDDRFIELLNAFKGYDQHSTYAPEAQAARVHEAVVRGMLRNGEPGYWNSTYSNEGEVNPVVATNPCGEIALPETGACVLGHVNLDYFAPKEKGGHSDFTGLRRAHELMTRFLIRATYGDMTDDQQREVMHSERRIGVGHLGVQGFLAKHGTSYSDAPHDLAFRNLLTFLYDTVRDEAREYAFTLRVPEPVKVTTVAPTGSIAKLPGVSEGIHPIYARHFLRRVRFSMTDPAQAATVQEAVSAGHLVEKCTYDQSGNTMVVAYPTKEKLVAEVEAMGYDPAIVESADEIDLNEMLAIQAMYQAEYADNAVSFTANFPEGKYTVEEAAGIIKAWLPDLKGTTLMPDGTREQAPYERLTAEQFAEYEVTSVEDSTDEECSTGACPVR